MKADEILLTLARQQEKKGWSNYKLKKETGLTIISNNPGVYSLVATAEALGLEVVLKPKNKKP